MNVNDCIQETISLLSHQFDLDNIEIKTSFETDIPEIVGDGEKLKQVFMNLLMNGKQAIQDKGTIAVSTDFDSDRNCIRIVVSDNGSGISRENLTKIFDPFFTTKPIGEGTGLGLSVSYGIVQDHNGRIEVKSKIGGGSDFTVLLPVKDSSGQPSSATTQDSVQ
jgi:signal transduction histidine kinase